MFRFTRTEVFAGQPTGNAPRTPARFRDSATGATWNGRGPRPAWLRGKDIEQYRIGEPG
ncbi:H-NS family nucleoid-associated regulatory protein [Paraburkholderia lacunae]